MEEIFNKINEKLSKSQIKKMKDKFDKTGKLPPHLMKLAKLMDKHTEVRNIVVPGLEWMSKLGEGKLTEDYKNSEWEVYLRDEKGNEKIVKKAKSKRAATILYNRIVKSDDYYEVGMRAIKESVNENTTYKVGDTISYWTIGRIDKGKAKVKGVTKARPNRLGIKNHYITNKGTFSDMEVVGTEAYKLRFKGNTEKKVMKAMGIKEGFGSDEFLTKTEKKKFEKERLENAEVLGYTLTGTKDLKESTIQEKTFTPIDKIKDIKNLVKKGLVSYRGASGGFEISIRNKKVPGFPPAFSLLQKDEKKYKDIMKKQFKIKPVEKFFIKSNELTQLKKFGTIPFLAPSKKESVFAVRQDKIKNGERFPKEPNFDYDPEKGKSRIRKVNEMTTSQAKDTLNHLGGKRFMVMTGAKPLTIDKKRKELLFKIGRNAKGINLVTIRLTSLDLYDMEFAQVRMGNKKVKAVEKRVYGDQLQKFFKKHTGMNTYL